MAEKPVDEMQLGQEAIRDGRITPQQMNACLEIRSRIEAQGLRPPGVLQIAREKGFLQADDMNAILGEPPPRRPRAPSGAARRTLRARAVEAERRRVRRAAGLLLFFALAATAGAVVVELLLRR